jgi:hypothetical protein
MKSKPLTYGQGAPLKLESATAMLVFLAETVHRLNHRRHHGRRALANSARISSAIFLSDYVCVAMCYKTCNTLQYKT